MAAYKFRVALEALEGSKPRPFAKVVIFSFCEFLQPLFAKLLECYFILVR